MSTFAKQVIETLGGTSAVSRMTQAPPSTVQSWKHNGIPPSRLSHLKLVAKDKEIAIDWTTGLPLAAEAEGIAQSAADETRNGGDTTGAAHEGRAAA